MLHLLIPEKKDKKSNQIIKILKKNIAKKTYIKKLINFNIKFRGNQLYITIYQQEFDEINLLEYEQMMKNLENEFFVSLKNKKIDIDCSIFLLFNNCTIKNLVSNFNLINTPNKIRFEMSKISIIAIDSEVFLYENYFNFCNFEEIYLQGTTKVNLRLNSQNIKKFEIKYLTENNSKNQMIKLGNCRIKDELLIEYSQINFDFKIDNTIEGKKELDITTYETIFNNQFFIINASIKTSYAFINTVFNDIVSFKNTTFIILNLNDALFNLDKTIDFSNVKIINKEKTPRDTFRKIKFFFEKENNKIEANKYHSHEMKARKKELSINKKEKYNFKDKLIFYTNDLISEHGLNWPLTIYWIFYFGLSFSTILYANDKSNIILSLIVLPITFYFILIYNSTQELESKQKSIYKYSIYGSGIIIPLLIYFDIYGIDFRPLLKFFNILDFKVLDKNELMIMNINELKKFISKIVMGYLIYHLITSLRKDTRR